jgi:hypothetical protein
MSYTTTVSPSSINQWLAEKLDPQQLRQKLLSQGWEEEKIADHINAFKKAKYAKRQSAGFIYLGIGALLGFVSCVLTMVNPVPELYDAILYGLTSVAMIFLFAGLYFLFE